MPGDLDGQRKEGDCAHLAARFFIASKGDLGREGSVGAVFLASAKRLSSSLWVLKGERCKSVLWIRSATGG